MRRIVISWLAICTTVLMIGIPSVLWGWWGMIAGGLLLLIANSTFELGKHVLNQDSVPQERE